MTEGKTISYTSLRRPLRNSGGILKIGGPVLIPHIHKIFNQEVKQGFPKTWTQSLIIPIFKSGDTNNPSNYQKNMISPLLAKLYSLFWKRRSTDGLKVKVSGLKVKRVLEGNTRQRTTSLRLRSLSRSVVMLYQISFAAFWTLERLSIWYLEIIYGID